MRRFLHTEFKALLRRAGLNQSEFARLTETSQKQVSFWCTGRAEPPQAMLVLATVLATLPPEISWDDVVEWPEMTEFSWSETLGVSDDADLKSANTAWRTLSKKYHPDRGGSTEKMIRVNAAYKAAKEQLR